MVRLLLATASIMQFGEENSGTNGLIKTHDFVGECVKENSGYDGIKENCDHKCVDALRLRLARYSGRELSEVRIMIVNLLKKSI